MQFTVAIDGPAAAGKGTIAKGLASIFGFAHLDTGLLYRAVGRRVLEGTPAAIAAATLRLRDIARTDLRTPDVSDAASKVATNTEVRAALVAFQREFARRDGGAILDGRDIGTVICPEAPVKLYVIADDETRARRRLAELLAKGEDTSFDRVLADLRARDARDSQRATSPLCQAEDAHLLDTTELSIDAAVDKATRIIEQELDRAKG